MTKRSAKPAKKKSPPPAAVLEPEEEAEEEEQPEVDATNAAEAESVAGDAGEAGDAGDAGADAPAGVKVTPPQTRSVRRVVRRRGKASPVPPPVMGHEAMVAELQATLPGLLGPLVQQALANAHGPPGHAGHAAGPPPGPRTGPQALQLGSAALPPQHGIAGQMPPVPAIPASAGLQPPPVGGAILGPGAPAPPPPAPETGVDWFVQILREEGEKRKKEKVGGEEKGLGKQALEVRAWAVMSPTEKDGAEVMLHHHLAPLLKKGEGSRSAPHAATQSEARAILRNAIFLLRKAGQVRSEEDWVQLAVWQMGRAQALLEGEATGDWGRAKLVEERICGADPFLPGYLSDGVKAGGPQKPAFRLTHASRPPYLSQNRSWGPGWGQGSNRGGKGWGPYPFPQGGKIKGGKAGGAAPAGNPRL